MTKANAKSPDDEGWSDRDKTIRALLYVAVYFIAVALCLAGRVWVMP